MEDELEHGFDNSLLVEAEAPGVGSTGYGTDPQQSMATLLLRVAALPGENGGSGVSHVLRPLRKPGHTSTTDWALQSKGSEGRKSTRNLLCHCLS